MKKISNLELSSLIIFEVVTTYSSIIFNIAKTYTSINCWITVILSYFFGFIPILLLLYISKYKPNLSINEKINTLFKSSSIINNLLCLIFLVISIILCYNISNFITSQLLYRTPTIICTVIFISLIIYHVIKGINAITKVSLILIVFNTILFILGVASLIGQFDINNLLPILKTDTSNIFITSIKIMSIHTLPLITILAIPKEKIDHPNKYNKTIILSYLLAAIITIIIVAVTCGVLGIYLVKFFEYPEYIVLKKVKLFGFLERIENIFSNQWIIASYIYISIMFYYISNNCFLKNKINTNYIIILIGIIVTITSSLIFKSNTMFNDFIKYIYPYITLSILIFYIIITIKIYLSKKKIKN